MYVIVPACSANTIQDKMEHIQDRATKNNVTINHEKTKEILFSANLRPGNDIQLPPPCQDNERVTSLVTLGVVIND